MVSDQGHGVGLAGPQPRRCSRADAHIRLAPLGLRLRSLMAVPHRPDTKRMTRELTPRQAAELLGVCPSTLRNLTAAGVLVSVPPEY